MKKIFFVLVFVIVSIGLFAEDDGNTARLDVGAGAALSVYSTYITLSPEVMYDMALFAVGGGVKNYFGLTFFDIYSAPYIIVELGWFYLGGGASFMLKPPDPEKSETGFTDPQADEELGFLPFLTLGMAPPLFDIGAGKLGFDVAVDFIATASPVEVVDDSGSVFGDVFGTILGTAITAVLNSFKLGISVFYQVGL